MSLNQLPEELISQVASHVNPEDMVSLLQTRKRINRAMKKYKMDKLKVEKIRLSFERNNFSGEFCRKEKVYPIGLMNNLERQEIVQYALSKFRSVEALSICAPGVFNLDKNLVSVITHSRTKIKKLELILEVDLNSTEFINFCNRNFEISLACEVNQQSIFCDDVFCQISSRHRFSFGLNLPSRNYAFLNLSDRWLETMMSSNTHANIGILWGRTNFTVKEIRRYIEECSSKNVLSSFFFGLLAPENGKDAAEWFNFSKQHPTKLDYSITDVLNDGRYYSIFRNEILIGGFDVARI